MANKIPITRLGKFFGENDFDLDISMGEEWLIGDMNFTCVLYRIDRQKTKTDDVYGETVSDGIKFLPPIEFNAFVQVSAPENKMMGSTRMDQMEPGNIRVSVYQKTLDNLNVDINFGDYIGYYETETLVRYYTVNNDGRVVSDNKHTYAGYKPFYRTISASPVGPNEFKGL
jgi:hypothetical protein|tara:strand:- start:399 stop:911 length:513 start_codon:yes stop_codon:yes gene_type:complete